MTAREMMGLMLKKALELNEAFCSKEGMAKVYGNLGNVYQMEGDLAHTEEMYRKALELDQALGSKEGMAGDYGSLGNVYQTRGDLAQAEAMYRKSIQLFQKIGAKNQSRQVQNWLDALVHQAQN